MSSQSASYRLSAAQRAAMREAARLRELHRQWQVAQRERGHQRRRAAQLSERYAVQAPKIRPLLAAGSETADDLTRELAAATEDTAGLQTQLDQLERQGRRQAIQTMIVSIVGDPAGAPVVGPGTTRRAESDSDRITAEALRVIARLDPDVDQSPRVSRLLEEIATVAQNRRAPLLTALRTEIDKLNATAARRRAESAVLASARTVVEQTGSRSLAALLTAMQTDVDSDRTIDVELVRRAIEAALHQDEQQRQDAYVLDTVIKALQAMDYEALPGLEVSTASGGVLARQDSGALRALHVKVESGVIAVTPARLISRTTGTTSAGAQEEGQAEGIDEETERIVCADTEQAWRRIDRAGVSVQGRVLRLSSTMPHVAQVEAEALLAPPATTRTRRATPKATERPLP